MVKRSPVEDRLQAVVDGLPVSVEDVAAVVSGRLRHATAGADVVFVDAAVADQLFDAGA